jgi:hypothetical protein
VACNRLVRRVTGVVLQLRNEGKWNFWKAHGIPHPNHSRPASSIADADIDAEDYPGRHPQKGH